jgi:hypothetical protein
MEQLRVGMFEDLGFVGVCVDEKNVVRAREILKAQAKYYKVDVDLIYYLPMFGTFSVPEHFSDSRWVK